MTVAEAVRWISVPAASEAARVRLLCLPHAGSGAAAFFRWRRLLPVSIAVCPVMLPGRESRLAEPLMTSLEEIVGQVFEAVDRLGLGEAPLAIFGHSMGSLLAFELARRLKGVQQLFVSGRNAPNAADKRPVLHRLEDQAFLDGVRQRYGSSADGLLDDSELRAIFLPILRADLTVVDTYRFREAPRLTCPVYALAGEDDHSVSDEGLAQWGSQTVGKFTAGRLPGDHFYHTGAGQRALLEMLRATATAP